MNRERIVREVERLGPWFHNLDLAGVPTAPAHSFGDYPRQKFARFQHAFPEDLRGRTVLDIGCNAGFYCIEMKRRGAERVVGIDFDDVCIAQARFASDVTGVDLELHRMSVYEVKDLRERFDIVLFMGVLHHLRHPLLALDLIHDHVVGGNLVFQSLIDELEGQSPSNVTRGPSQTAAVGDDHPLSERAVFDEPSFPRLHFVEKRYGGDPTTWWIPNRACTEAMLRSAGFKITGHPEEEIYICELATGGSKEEDAR
jgi:tRNA (mo5U34)-methyltransferase